MKTLRTAANFAAFLLALPLGAQNNPPAEKVEVPAAGVNLPMGDLGGRPLVEVSVNGKGPYRFILDTGASDTVVDDKLRDELALPPATGPAAHLANGSPTELIKIDDLRIGDASLRGVVANLLPLSRMFGGGDPPRGVLSAASFPGYLVVLDYPGKRVLIRKGELPAADARTRFEYTAEQILPNVPVRIGETEVRVHVDSGSPGSLTLPAKYLKELPLASEPAEVGRARTAHGEFSIWSAQVKGSIELGRYKLDLPAVQFSDVNPIPGPPTGNIGYRTLQRFVVTLDSKNRRIQFDQ